MLSEKEQNSNDYKHIYLRSMYAKFLSIWTNENICAPYQYKDRLSRNEDSHYKDGAIITPSDIETDSRIWEGGRNR